MNEIVKRETSPLVIMGSKFEIEPNKLLEVLRGTVIKPDKNGNAATNEEVAAFCIVANQYGLNPFTHEIHAFTSSQKGVVPIVGIDGWTHIVNARGDFNGCEFIEEESPDGKPVKITCRMHVKDREHPVEATERFLECRRDTIPWNTMPWRMLRHKAYMQAARYAFGLSGIYDEDEARDITAQVQVKESIRMPTIGTALPPTPPPPPPEGDKKGKKGAKKPSATGEGTGKEQAPVTTPATQAAANPPPPEPWSRDKAELVIIDLPKGPYSMAIKRANIDPGKKLAEMTDEEVKTLHSFALIELGQ